MVDLNPDVMCNKLIKFGCFEQQVEKSLILRQPGIMPPRCFEMERLGWVPPLTLCKRPDRLSGSDRLSASLETDVSLGGLMKQEVRRCIKGRIAQCQASR